MSSKEISDIVDNLKGSPMFALSLASKELFHSNFLAWIFETFPEFTYNFFAGYISASFKEPKIKVYREKLKVDITIEFTENGSSQKIVIENKVKSRVSIYQLEKYSENCAPNTIMMLLSPYKPFLFNADNTWISKNGLTWQYLSYTELAEQFLSLKQSAFLNRIEHAEYFRYILTDYADFISAISEIASKFLIENDSEYYDYYSHDFEILRKIRIHDLYIKVKYSEMLRLLEQRLLKNQSNIDSNNMTVVSGYSNNSGIIDYKHRIYYDEEISVTLGIQLQGNQYRIVCESSDSELNIAIASSLKKKAIWFNFDLLMSVLPEIENSITQGKGRKISEFAQYSKNTFLYKYIKLPNNIPVGRILDSIAEYDRYIIDNYDKILNLITKMPEFVKKKKS